MKAKQTGKNSRTLRFKKGSTLQFLYPWHLDWSGIKQCWFPSRKENREHGNKKELGQGWTVAGDPGKRALTTLGGGEASNHCSIIRMLMFHAGVNRILARRIWPKKRTDCWICFGNPTDWRSFTTQWIVDQLWILTRIPDRACPDVRILGPKRNLDRKSFLSLRRYVNEFIQIISVFEQSSFKLRCGTVVWIVL